MAKKVLHSELCEMVELVERIVREAEQIIEALPQRFLRESPA
jgi:hypothetical protein